MLGVLLFLILAAAFVFLVLATFQLPTRRVNFGWAGLALWLLAILIIGMAGNTSIRGFEP
jgi:hypothetical protein